MATILLVCTGNICRSPMAEGFLRRELEGRGLQDIEVESSGVSGWDGSPATPEAVDALREYGLDIGMHRARRLGRPMLEWAALVIAMSAEHRDAAARLHPKAAARTFTLKELVYLLEMSPPLRQGATDEEQLRASVDVASHVRATTHEMDLMDEDIADPLGLGIESFRAVAWELEDLCRRVADGLFPGTGGASVNGENGDGMERTPSHEGGAR